MGQCVDKVILAGGIFVLVAKCVRPMYGGLAHCRSSSSITKILILAFCVIYLHAQAGVQNPNNT